MQSFENKLPLFFFQVLHSFLCVLNEHSKLIPMSTQTIIILLCRRYDKMENSNKNSYL